MQWHANKAGKHKNTGGRRTGFAIALALVSAAAAQGQIMIEEKVPYNGTSNNIRLSNGMVELILTTDYGPRIMRYALAGSGEAGNLFATMPGVTASTELGDWYIRGGHRLWIAPEAKPRSYEPDNEPIKTERDGDTIKLIPALEKTTRIQKEIWITLDPQTSHVTLVHRLTNRGLFPVEMACWGVSVMNTEGLALFPQEPYVAHTEDVLPSRPLVLWKYTNMTDPRWMWGKSLLTLRQDPQIKEPQKVGLLNKQGWAAYCRNSTLFLKRYPYEAGKTYPDFNSNTETFTNDAMLEIETLGPLEMVQPGQTITHTEHWWLFKNVRIGDNEAAMLAALQPLLSETAPKK